MRYTMNQRNEVVADHGLGGRVVGAVPALGTVWSQTTAGRDALKKAGAIEDPSGPDVMGRPTYIPCDANTDCRPGVCAQIGGTLNYFCVRSAQSSAVSDIVCRPEVVGQCGTFINADGSRTCLCVQNGIGTRRDACCGLNTTAIPEQP